VAITERDYDSGDITGKQYSAREARLTEELAAATNALERSRAHVETVEQDGVATDAEEVLLDHLAKLKRAVAEGVEEAPDLDALRNVIGEMFEAVHVIRHPGFGSGRGRTGVVPNVPGPDPQVKDGAAAYWLWLTLRSSAVDMATFKPVGQEMPVGCKPQYPRPGDPDSTLCRYCWWYSSA
jgi:hypothetical protein